MADVKYPEIKVKLVGEDGNAFSILGRVRKALRNGGVPQDKIEEFTKEATSGDYDHLLQTVMNWVEGPDVEGEEEDDEGEDDDPDE